MKKMFQLILTLFLLGSFGEIAVQADDLLSATAENGLVASSDTQNSTEDTGTRAITAGDGTENNPYQVSNMPDLKTALGKSMPSGSSALYIRLVGDIVYTDSDREIKVNKSTVLDGAGHYILYNDTTYNLPHFSTGANNLNITFKNIKYGNKSYVSSSYFGILYTGNSNINFVVENIEYTMSRGCEPFWGNSNSSNTLTFKGTNTFKSAGNTYGGEFVEGFQTINFADNSKTTVENDSTNSDSVFWCLKQQINIGKNATLEIKTSKETLIQDGGDVQINVQEKGQLICKFISGTYYKDLGTKLIDGLLGSSLTLNFYKDAIGRFSTEKNTFSGKNPTINATSPNYIVFETAPTSKSVLNNLTPKFVRKDKDGYNYPIDYLTTSGQKHLVSNVTNNQSVSASNIQNGYSVAYARASQMIGLAATPKAAPDISEIEARVKQGPASQLSNGRVFYKLAKTKLYSGNDIMLGASQNSIEQATSANGVLDSSAIDVTNDVATDSRYGFQNLLAQTYYLYSKLDEQLTALVGYTFSSPWVEQVVVVQPLIAVTIPNQIDFTSIRAGAFDKRDNLQNYAVTNHGNVPVNVDFKTIVINSGCSPDVSLVDQFGNEVGKLVLKLTAENATSAKIVTWSPLLANTPIPSNPMQLAPFWEKGNQASLYVNGQWSALANKGAKTVSYKLTVDVKQATR